VATRSPRRTSTLTFSSAATSFGIKSTTWSNSSRGIATTPSIGSQNMVSPFDIEISDGQNRFVAEAHRGKIRTGEIVMPATMMSTFRARTRLSAPLPTVDLPRAQICAPTKSHVSPVSYVGSQKWFGKKQDSMASSRARQKAKKPFRSDEIKSHSKNVTHRKPRSVQLLEIPHPAAHHTAFDPSRLHGQSQNTSDSCTRLSRRLLDDDDGSLLGQIYPVLSFGYGSTMVV
jgi:hypothetical protein